MRLAAIMLVAPLAASALELQPAQTLLSPERVPDRARRAADPDSVLPGRGAAGGGQSLELRPAPVITLPAIKPPPAQKPAAPTPAPQPAASLDPAPLPIIVAAAAPAEQSAAERRAAAKSFAEKSATEKLATEKSSAEKSAAAQPAAEKPATAKPLAASPAAPAARPQAGPAAGPAQPMVSRLNQLQQLLGVPTVLEIERPEVLRAREQRRGVLSLEAALALGVTESVDARIAQAQDEGQQATGRAAWRQLGPKLDYRRAEGEAEYTAVTGPTPRLRRGDESLTLRQPLFDWSSYHEALRQGRNAEATALISRNAASLAALESANVYLATLQSRLIIGYTVEYEALLRKLLQFMVDRAGAGGASPADLERVRARVENIRAAISENRAGLVTNLTQFVRLIGQLPERLEIPRSLTGPLPGDEQRAISAALDRNYELRAARSYAEAAGYERAATRGRLMPRFDLELARAENRNPSGSSGLQVDERALVILSWNLFSAGVDVAQLQAVAARRNEFLLRVENSERRLRQQLESSYSVLDSIGQRFAAVREEVIANRKVVDAFNEQLFATNRQLLDVLDAYQRFYQSKVDLTNLLVTEAQVQVQVAHLIAALYPADGPAR